jgi:glycine/D-amino acid oxidase-like deaminating enzyme
VNRREVKEVKDVIAAFERLGTGGPPQRPERVVDNACVPGGGIAGLLAARVLAEHAGRVVVIDRDTADDDSRPGNGVPQGRHVHTLLPGGLRWMERWLPGLTQQVQDGGGVLSAPAQTVRAFADATFMLAHPATLADPALIERADAVAGKPAAAPPSGEVRAGRRTVNGEQTPVATAGHLGQAGDSRTHG